MTAAVVAAIGIALQIAQAEITAQSAHHDGTSPMTTREMAVSVAKFNLALKRSQDLAAGIIDP